MEKEIFASETKIMDNETCLPGLKKSHEVASGYCAKLIVLEGMLEFIYEDTNETFIVDSTKPFKIEPKRLHHINLMWTVKFKLEFYKLVA